MAKNAPVNYRISAVNPGNVTLKGTIMSVSPRNVIMFRYKKPRSSKYAIKTIAWDDLIAYSGEQGKEGFVTFKSANAVALNQIKGSIEMDEKLGLAQVTTEDNEVIFIKPVYMNAVAEDDIDAPAPAVKKEKTEKSEKSEKVKPKMVLKKKAAWSQRV